MSNQCRRLSAYHFHDAWFEHIHWQGENLWITLSHVARLEDLESKADWVQIELTGAQIVACTDWETGAALTTNAWELLVAHEGKSQLFRVTQSEPNQLTMVVNGMAVFEIVVAYQDCNVLEEEAPCRS